MLKSIRGGKIIFKYMAGLAARLAWVFVKSHNLEEEIKELLGVIVYEF